MNKEKAMERLTAIEEETRQLREALSAPDNAPEKALRLEVDEYGCLRIYYGDEQVGHISTKGKCYILSTDTRVNTYNLWREEGMHIDPSVVEWRGGKYRITERGNLYRNAIIAGSIYDFKECMYSSNCKDTNIKRHAHNNRAIGY